MKIRTFDEAVDHFIEQVRMMQIEDRYKVQLIGMVSGLQLVHENEKGDGNN